MFPAEISVNGNQKIMLTTISNYITALHILKAGKISIYLRESILDIHHFRIFRTRLPPYHFKQNVQKV